MMTTRRYGLALTVGDEVPTDGITLQLAADGAAKLVWIQLAEVGTFRGHPSGPFSLTPAIFGEIVRNFERDGLPVPIDYEHASEADPTSGTIPIHGAPAIGWIHRLENRGEAGLWGLVEWSAQAREQIRSGAYRYISPAIRFGARDRVTGENVGAKLTSAALTNQPFLRMQRVAASDRAASAGRPVLRAYSSDEVLPAIRAALGCGDLVDAAAMRSAVAALRAGIEMAGGVIGAAPEHMRQPLERLRAMVSPGVGSATWHEVFEAIEEMIEAAMQRHEVEHHADELTAMVAASDHHNHPTITGSKMSKMENETDKDAEISRLTLQLADANARASTLEAEVTALREQAERRMAEDIEAEASAILATHSHLTESARPHIVRMLRADPEAVRALYPLPSPAEARYAHLFRQVVPMQPRPADARAMTAVAASGAEPTVVVMPDGTELDRRVLDESVRDTTQRLMAEEHLSYEAASSRAFALHHARRRAQQAAG